MWTAEQVLAFNWIAGTCQVNLLLTGRVVRKQVNELKNNFFRVCKVIFFTAFVYFEIIQTQNRRPNNLQKT